MKNTPFPPPAGRPASTPDARERARALLGAASRRQNLFAHALNSVEARTESAPADEQSAAMTGATPGTRLDDVVQHLTRSSDQDMAASHSKLTQARAQAQRNMAQDPELLALMQAAYGPAPGQVLPPTKPDQLDVVDVVDVQARILPKPSSSP
jgi:hypothetical protein